MGDVCLDEDSAKIGECWLSSINDNFGISQKYFTLKDPKYNKLVTSNYWTDEQVKRLSLDKSNSYHKGEIWDIDALLDMLEIGALFSNESGDIGRHGYLLVRKDVFDSLLSKLYHVDAKRVESNIKQMFSNKKLVLESDLEKALEIQNHCDSLFQHLANDITEKKFDGCIGEQAVYDVFVRLSVIVKMYSALGKSFYPNVHRKVEMEQLYNFNSVINEFITRRVECNENTWSNKHPDKPISPLFKWHDSMPAQR